SDPYQQPEHVRISPQPLSVDDALRLWSAMQVQYRPSAAYEVSVVLIESAYPVQAPLPVLSLGQDGRGPTASASRHFSLERLKVPPGRPTGTVQVGDIVTLRGVFPVGVDRIEVELHHARLGSLFLAPEPSSPTT